MRAPVATLLMLLGWLLAVGCGPGVEEGFLEVSATDADTDSDVDSDTDTDSDTDADSDTDTDVWHDCPYQLDSDCQGGIPELDVLLAATEIDLDVSFVAMGRNTLLASRSPEGVTEPLIVMMDFDEYEGVEALGLATLPATPEEPMTPIGVAGDLEDEVFGFAAMALVDDGDGYTLLGTNVQYEEIGPLLPVPGGDVPAPGELRGLIYLQQKVPEQDPQYQLVCAFGDGVFCFDGVEWTTELPAGTGGPVNDVGLLLADERRMLVAGDDGFLARDSATGWNELVSGTTSDLLAVSVDDGWFLAAGRDGAVVWGTPSSIYPCVVGDGTTVTLSGIPDEAVSGVLESGPIFLWSPGLDEYGPTMCETGAEQLGAVDSRIVGCDSSLNLFILTATDLHGGSECVVVE